MDNLANFLGGTAKPRSGSCSGYGLVNIFRHGTEGRKQWPTGDWLAVRSFFARD